MKNVLKLKWKQWKSQKTSFANNQQIISYSVFFSVIFSPFTIWIYFDLSQPFRGKSHLTNWITSSEWLLSKISFTISQESEIVIAGKWNTKDSNRLWLFIVFFYSTIWKSILKRNILGLFLVDMPDFGSIPYLGTESLSQQDESESTFENKSGLADDLKFLASMPELCDVTFLVGETREPVCAVKVRETLTQFHNYSVMFFSTHAQAILSARSRIFHKLLYQQQASPQRKNQPPPSVRENKLRLFLKRSSEPLLNIQNESQKVRKWKNWEKFGFIYFRNAPQKCFSSTKFFRAEKFPRIVKHSYLSLPYSFFFVYDVKPLGV